MINTGVKRKKRSELGIALSSPRRFEAREKTGDRIKDGVRNGIKDGWGGDGRGGEGFNSGNPGILRASSTATLSFSA